MKNYVASQNVLSELGKRLRAYRVDYPLTQKELAEKSGISIRSIARIENGEDLQLSTFIKLLFALDLENNIDSILPDPTKRPSFYLKDQAQTEKKRCVKTKNGAIARKNIVWGEDFE